MKFDNLSENYETYQFTKVPENCLNCRGKFKYLSAEQNPNNTSINPVRFDTYSCGACTPLHRSFICWDIDIEEIVNYMFPFRYKENWYIFHSCSNKISFSKAKNYSAIYNIKNGDLDDYTGSSFNLDFFTPFENRNEYIERIFKMKAFL